jgi:hypothetical protein
MWLQRIVPQCNRCSGDFPLRVPIDGSRAASLAHGWEYFQRLPRHRSPCRSNCRWIVSTSPLTRVLSAAGSSRSASVLAFGIPYSEDQITADSGTETVRLFSPGAVFCIVWWQRLSHKKQHRTLTILEAPRVRGDGDAVLNVHPAAIVHVFMDQYGPPGQERSIDQMLDLIQRTRDRGIEPASVTTRYWRRASRRILLAQNPPELTDGDFSSQEQSA